LCQHQQQRRQRDFVVGPASASIYIIASLSTADDSFHSNACGDDAFTKKILDAVVSAYNEHPEKRQDAAVRRRSLVRK
jgi:hypothetical protein